jgi:hypothetical protein
MFLTICVCMCKGDFEIFYKMKFEIFFLLIYFLNIMCQLHVKQRNF